MEGEHGNEMFKRERRRGEEKEDRRGNVEEIIEGRRVSKEAEGRGEGNKGQGRRGEE